MAIEQSLQANFNQAFEIYTAGANDKEGVPILCKIHDAFGGQEGPHHNCLGCNFADSQTIISNHLSKYETYIDVQESVSLYIMTLYLLVVRMETVMDIVQVPTVFREKHFKVFQQIHKWANFIKHPKAFILTHHPSWDFENSGEKHEKAFKVEINDSFVDKYYKGERDPDKQKARNKELYGKLRNQTDVHVLFPEMAQLTKKVCYSINAFADLITKNQVYIEILNDETTIAEYFENQDKVSTDTA